MRVGGRRSRGRSDGFLRLSRQRGFEQIDDIHVALVAGDPVDTTLKAGTKTGNLGFAYGEQLLSTGIDYDLLAAYLWQNRRRAPCAQARDWSSWTPLPLRTM